MLFIGIIDVLLMCKELNEEIQRGEKAVRDLAQHLVNMGAANMERTIAIEDSIVQIKVDIRAKLDLTMGVID